MTTIVLDEIPGPSTEGRSSRLNAIIGHLRAVDPDCRVLCAHGTPPPRSRALFLLVGVARVVRLLARVLVSRGRLVLLSSPALPFHRSESRIDQLLVVSFLRLLRAGCRLTGKVVLLNLHDVRSMQIPAFGIPVDPAVLRLYRRLERLTFACCDYLLAPTGAWPDCLTRDFGVRPEQLIEFHNGNSRLADDALPLSPIGDGPGLKLVYAGTMGQSGRELDGFLERFVALERRDVSLWLLGPGGPTEPTGPWADPRVHLLGALPLPECIAAVRSCDLAVYPYPDLPYFNMTHATNKMALYVTCRVPLLARQSHHVTEFVRRHDIGIACTLDEVPQAIERVAHDPSVLAHWRERLDHVAEDYYWDVIIDRAFRAAIERAGLPLEWPGIAPTS